MNALRIFLSCLFILPMAALSDSKCEPVYYDVVQKIMDYEFANSDVMANADWLCNVFGPRNVKTPVYRASAEWVRDRLRAAVVRASDKPKPYFIRATTFAFFESYDSFIIRLGELGKNASHIRMKLEDDRFWRITGIYD